MDLVSYGSVRELARFTWLGHTLDAVEMTFLVITPRVALHPRFLKRPLNNNKLSDTSTSRAMEADAAASK